MKHILLFFILIFPFSLAAQKTKKVTEKLSDGSKEVYYVLKDSVQIRQGSFEHYNSSGNLTEKGFYKMGIKDSIWEEYNRNSLSASGYYRNNQKNGHWKEYSGKEIRSEGEYVNGVKSGNWNIYNSEGKAEQIYNFSTKEVSGCDTNAYSIEERTQKILIGNDSVLVLLDCPAMYNGGKDIVYMMLRKNVRYPIMEKEKNIQGIVYISFDVDIAGKTSNYRIAQGVSPGLDQEALRAMKLINENWSPAIYKGKPVASSVTYPVKFILQ